MVLKTLDKQTPFRDIAPNLSDYASACKNFSWEAAARDLAGLPEGGVNIAWEAVDRFARGPLRERAALRFTSPDAGIREISYGRLSELSNRFANVLDGLGLGPGDRIATLLGRVPDLYITVLGALKRRCVVCPLYTAFGPEPIGIRLELAGAGALVTTEALFQRKIEPRLDALPGLRHVILGGPPPSGPPGPRCSHLSRLMSAAGSDFRIGRTDPETPALLHFTSGTTGKPKGALHVHRAVLTHRVSGSLALDIHPGDLFWCTADPGWVTGTSYGIIAPLTLGATLLVDEAPFDPERWYGILERERVNVWYTSPTAIRMMMRLGTALPRGFDTTGLRFLASVGEPLNPGAVTWGREAFGLPFHDTWWQTETGGILIANYRAMAIRPGSMGRPMPGIGIAVMQHSQRGDTRPAREPDVTGELAIRKGWPAMFRAYLGEPQRYARCFSGDWYMTGDLVRQDRDGYVWFIGRRDDLIKSSGHLIGPFEVENALMSHPAVAEAGVIGRPDPTAMEIVKAFVVLKRGRTEDETLRRDILAHTRRLLGAVLAPKELAFCDALPRTRSGKILRRLLRSRESGEPPGDLSTLESAESE